MRGINKMHVIKKFFRSRANDNDNVWTVRSSCSSVGKGKKLLCQRVSRNDENKNKIVGFWGMDEKFVERCEGDDIVVINGEVMCI